jgi:uncharacterized Zn finger protein
MTGHESAPEKARRYLAEGRLTVLQVDGDLVRAVCRGTGAIYQLGHTPGRGWRCSCAARGDCAHLLALMSVTVRRSA